MSESVSIFLSTNAPHLHAVVILRTLCRAIRQMAIQSQTKGVIIMVKLGKVSVETRGLKQFVIAEGGSGLLLVG